MNFGDPLGDGKAKSCAARSGGSHIPPGSRAISSKESIENVWLVLERNALPRVGDADLILAVRASRANRDVSRFGRELHCVIDEVQHQAMNQLFVCFDEQFGRRFAAQVNALRYGNASERANAIGEKLVEVKARGLNRISARIRSDQEEEVLDDAGELRRGGLHDLDTLPVFAGTAIVSGQHDICLALNDGKRRAQFMRRVSHEALLRLECALKTLEEVVERRCQIAELVTLVSNFDAIAQRCCSD